MGGKKAPPKLSSSGAPIGVEYSAGTIPNQDYSSVAGRQESMRQVCHTRDQAAGSNCSDFGLIGAWGHDVFEGPILVEKGM